MARSTFSVLSVGGSIIIPPSGFSISFLKRFRSLILARVEKGHRFILVIGGGATSRSYQAALGNIVRVSDEEKDWMGIYATYLNAQFVRLFFKAYAHATVVTHPTHKVIFTEPILVAAGWKPGMTTDKDAVLLAEHYGATEIINLSNIDYVYTKDPNRFTNAKKIEQMRWHEYRQMIGEFTPGGNWPFDPEAAKKAEELGLRVTVMNGQRLGELKKMLQGKTGKGTVLY